MTTRGKTIVFLGPTLKHAAAQKLCPAEFRGPAAMGDITCAVSDRAELIVLVDGVFESGPSVWHKEIMWAISCGIPVIGASSMGALRAAELNHQGMMGYGEVYEDFATGRLNDDDEVAVLHGPPETSWLPLTDAMVDIRYHANNAVAAGVLTHLQAACVIAHAKAEFFKRRSFIASSTTVLNETSVRRQALSWYTSQSSGIKEKDCSSLLSNLQSVSADAQKCLQNKSAFLPTVYLSRLQEFGFVP